MDYKKNDRIKIISFILFCLIVLFSFTSCKTKKEIVETHSTDTIYKSEIITVDKPQLSEIVFNNPCDSLGQLNPIFYTYTTDNVKATLKSEHNTLKLDINVDSIVNSKVNEFKSSIKTEKEVIINEVKRPLNTYLLFYAICSTLFILRKPLLKLILPV